MSSIRVYNNVEDKIIFEGNEKEFIDFMLIILEENEGSIFGRPFENLQDCIDYTNHYCDNLEIVE